MLGPCGRAPQCRRVTQPVAFTRTVPLGFAKKLGLAFGWLCITKKDGVPYVDLHGDHFPDDEIVAAVDELMAKPASEREINIEHEGPARGSIATAQALTEDIAKALGIDTGGTYGAIGSFRPDADLLKSLESGGAYKLSIEGHAGDVEIVKSADGAIAATAHKRTMRKVTLTKLAVVKAGAHEGAEVAIIKSAEGALIAIAKRTPVATTAVDGHAHVIDDVSDADCKVGCTSWDSAMSSYGGHSHSWIRNPDGSISIVASAGHSHDIATATDLEKTAMPTDLEKTQAETIAKSASRIAALSAALLAVATLPPDQHAFAKSLTPDALEGFLALTPAERATRATPVHKSIATGETYFAGDPRIEIVKALDATHAELAKSREAGEIATFAKTATEKFPSLLGGIPAGAAIAKAIAKALTGDEAKLAMDAVTAASAAITKLCTPVGHGGVEDEGSPAAKLDALAKAHQAKNPSLSFAKAFDDVLSTSAGAALYAQDQAARPRASA